LDCGYKSVWVLLNNGPLTEFSPTLFGFASQGVTSKLHLFRFTILRLDVSNATSGLFGKKERPTPVRKQLCRQTAFPTPKSYGGKHLRILIQFGVGEATG
jgi:hypothetical protein